MSCAFRHAMCNEPWGRAPLVEVCRSLKRAGYDGIEIAPFTLAESPAQISSAERREYRDMIRSEGLEFVGLHWLLVSPPGLQVTTPEPGVWERSWRHVDHLVDLCADLGDGGVMVFGSPKQRETAGLQTPAEAVRRFTAGLASVAPHAEQRGVTILVEALPSDQCDVINRLEDAVAVVDQIASPAVRTMFDTHNAVDETEPHPALIERFFRYIRHVHVNEVDGRHPGTGNYDFRAVLEALCRLGYDRWVSLEAFDFRPDADTIARESLRFLETCQ